MKTNIFNQIDEAIEAAKSREFNKISIRIETRVVLVISSPAFFTLTKHNALFDDEYTLYVRTREQMEEYISNIKKHYKDFYIEIQPITSAPLRAASRIEISWKNKEKKGDVNDDNTN